MGSDLIEKNIKSKRFRSFNQELSFSRSLRFTKRRPVKYKSPLTVRLYSSGLLYVYTCDWNYRPDHCMYGNNCGAAQDNGISVIHGNRGVYHNDKQVFFKAIYTAMRDFKPGDSVKLLARHMAQNLQGVSDPYCGAMRESALKYPNRLSK